MSRQDGASSSLMALDKRSKIMLAVLAGVVLIAALYFLVLKKSGSSDSNATGPVAKPSSTSTVAPKAAATPKAKAPVATPAPVVLSDSTRDPFQPLPEEVVAVASANPTAAPSSTPTSTPTSSSSSSSTTTHSVQLLSITGDSASVSYDKGTAKTVKAGSTIATGMSVVKIDASALFVSYNNKLYAIAPGQTVSI
jgi:hypothetical protein